MPGVLKCMETLYAPLPLITVSAYLESPISMNIGEYGVERVQIGKLTVPTDEVGRMLINYRGAGKTFPHIPVTDRDLCKTPILSLRAKRSNLTSR